MKVKKITVVLRIVFWSFAICAAYFLISLYLRILPGERHPYERMPDIVYTAMKNPDPEIIKNMVESGADVNVRDRDGMTALMWAANYNPNPEMITTLLDLGANPKLMNNRRFLAIDYAKFNDCLKNTEVIRKLEEVTAQILDASNPDDFFSICKIGSLQQVKDAIKAGADVNEGNRYEIPLVLAASNNSNPEVVIALVEAGADVNGKGSGGMTPLKSAAMYNSNPEVIMALLKLGADPKERQNAGIKSILFTRGIDKLINTEALRILEEASK